MAGLGLGDPIAVTLRGRLGVKGSSSQAPPAMSNPRPLSPQSRTNVCFAHGITFGTAASPDPPFSLLSPQIHIHPTERTMPSSVVITPVLIEVRNTDRPVRRLKKRVCLAAMVLTSGGKSCGKSCLPLALP